MTKVCLKLLFNRGVAKVPSVNMGLTKVFFCLALIYATAYANFFHFGRNAEHGFLLPPPPNPNREAKAITIGSFTQKLDHFDTSNTQTFQQRYYVNDAYYKPGGPAFIFIGGESAASIGWMGSGMWIAWAEKYGALTFQLEHRYYGASVPTPDLSVESLEYLTSEQALADLADFRDAMVEQYEIPDAKWIAFGGSYAGALAAWLVLKYPNQFDGAVGSSGPVLAEVDFKEYLEVVSQAINDTDIACDSAIRSAIQELEALVATPAGSATVTDLFQLCSPLDGTDYNDVTNLYSFLYGNFQGIVQYNNIPGQTYSIDDLCAIMTDTSVGTPVERYAAVNTLLLNYYGSSCLSYRYNLMILGFQDDSLTGPYASGWRQWMYQSCREFGYFQTTDSENQPFGHNVPIEFIVNQCSEVYGPSFSPANVNTNVDNTNANYGGKNIQVQKVIFPNGSVDPWHALGIITDLSTGAKAVYVIGSAHCADMYERSLGEPAGLEAARTAIDAQIGEWLAA